VSAPSRAAAGPAIRIPRMPLAASKDHESSPHHRHAVRAIGASPCRMFPLGKCSPGRASRILSKMAAAGAGARRATMLVCCKRREGDRRRRIKRRRPSDHVCECDGRSSPASAIAGGSSRDRARTVASREAGFGGGSKVDPDVRDANENRRDVGGTVRWTGASLIRELAREICSS